MTLVVLDTTVVAAVMHRQPDAIRRLGEEAPSDVVLSTPVSAEIHFGLARLPAGSRRRRLLEGEYERLRAAVTWLDWTEPAAVEFGRQKAYLAAAGTPIGDFDVAIGAIAVVAGARVATRNVRHFERLDGLAVESWG